MWFEITKVMSLSVEIFYLCCKRKKSENFVLDRQKMGEIDCYRVVIVVLDGF